MLLFTVPLLYPLLKVAEMLMDTEDLERLTTWEEDGYIMSYILMVDSINLLSVFTKATSVLAFFHSIYSGRPLNLFKCNKSVPKVSVSLAPTFLVFLLMQTLYSVVAMAVFSLFGTTQTPDPETAIILAAAFLGNVYMHMLCVACGDRGVLGEGISGMEAVLKAHILLEWKRFSVLLTNSVVFVLFMDLHAKIVSQGGMFLPARFFVGVRGIDRVDERSLFMSEFMFVLGDHYSGVSAANLLYLECKDRHREEIDKSRLAARLRRYIGED